MTRSFVPMDLRQSRRYCLNGRVSSSLVQVDQDRKSTNCIGHPAIGFGNAIIMNTLLRDDVVLDRMRTDMRNNPRSWTEDKFHPKNHPNNLLGAKAFGQLITPQTNHRSPKCFAHGTLSIGINPKTDFFVQDNNNIPRNA
jgi:hypothetical protein